MRLVYLDEAGISNPAQEPILVVAGVVVDPDRQWKELESYFRNLAHDLFPYSDPYRFVFHAKDVFHGSGAFDRQRWLRPQRMKILNQLAQVPRLFNLPIVVGRIDRVEADREMQRVNPTMTVKARLSVMHTQAFIQAVQCAQYWMERNVPDESAMLIAEDKAELKEVIRNVHEGYTDQTLDNEGAFRAPNIVDAVHFAKKNESLLLQLADHCAFIIKRKLMLRRDVDECYSALQSRIQWDFTPVKGFVYRVRRDEIELVTDKEEIQQLRTDPGNNLTVR